MNNKVIELDFSNAINDMAKTNIVSKLFEFQNQFKIFHWQTFSYAQHNAFGGLYDSLSDTIDTFVETYQGVYGRMDFEGVCFNFTNLSSADFSGMLQDMIMNISQWENFFSNTDLLNIRDEILGSLNKTAYLLTLM